MDICDFNIPLPGVPSQSLLGHQSFLSLVLSCLRGQDEQREFLLRALMTQMEVFISNAKDMMVGVTKT